MSRTNWKVSIALVLLMGMFWGLNLGVRASLREVYIDRAIMSYQVGRNTIDNLNKSNKYLSSASGLKRSIARTFGDVLGRDLRKVIQNDSSKEIYYLMLQAINLKNEKILNEMIRKMPAKHDLFMNQKVHELAYRLFTVTKNRQLFDAFRLHLHENPKSEVDFLAYVYIRFAFDTFDVPMPKYRIKSPWKEKAKVKIGSSGRLERGIELISRIIHRGAAEKDKRDFRRLLKTMESREAILLVVCLLESNSLDLERLKWVGESLAVQFHKARPSVEAGLDMKLGILQEDEKLAPWVWLYRPAKL